MIMSFLFLPIRVFGISIIYQLILKNGQTNHNFIYYHITLMNQVQDGNHLREIRTALFFRDTNQKNETDAKTPASFFSVSLLPRI